MGGKSSGGYQIGTKCPNYRLIVTTEARESSLGVMRARASLVRVLKAFLAVNKNISVERSNTKEEHDQEN
jgi:hypothetical protein